MDFNGLGIDKLHSYAEAFGLGQPTGVDLPGEVTGIAPDPTWKKTATPDNPWSLGDTLFTAIGQGDNLVTPLQLVNVTAAVANGGTLYQPQLVLNVTELVGQDRAGLPVESDTAGARITRQSGPCARGHARRRVRPGEGHAAGHITLKSVQWAGKTGTAEFGNPIAMKNGVEVRRAHAWFTAFRSL